MRKQFTPTERMAIGKATEKQLGERQGQRTDKLGENFPQVEKGRTADIAAKKAGLGSGKTFE